MRLLSNRAVVCCGLVAAFAGLVWGSVISQAASVTYTDRSTFEASLPTGFFSNNFSSVPDAIGSPVATVTGSGGTPTLGYDVTAPTAGLGVFPGAGFKAIGNWSPSQNMVVTFTSGNIFSAGGDIWLSDINGDRLAGTVTVDFNEGTSIPVPSTTSGSLGFAGITTTGSPLTTMTLQASSGSFLNLSNLTVATVPEPGSLTLAGLAAAGLTAAARQRRRSA
jgi:hypothetical protein